VFYQLNHDKDEDDVCEPRSFHVSALHARPTARTRGRLPTAVKYVRALRAHATLIIALIAPLDDGGTARKQTRRIARHRLCRWL